MNRTNKRSLERRKLRDLINEYSALGYEVFALYKGYQEPKSIGGFVPDMIAKKGDDMIIVEIATKRDLPSLSRKMEQFSRYADKYENVRFDFVLTNPRPRLSQKEKESSNRILLADIQESLLMEAKELHRKGYYQASLLMLSVLFENVLRKFSIKKKAIGTNEKIPLKQLSYLLRSKGVISKSNFESIKLLIDQRNRCVHELYRPDKSVLAEHIRFVSYFMKNSKW